MEPIFVPAPPKSAFNKNRRVSDLLLHQLKHFQHVEQKNGIQIDPALSRDVHTEGGAARYVTEMTRAIKAQFQVQSRAQSLSLTPIQTQTQASEAGIAVVPPTSQGSRAPESGLDIAAARSRNSKPSKRKKP